MLWHEQTGPLLVAGMNAYQLVEAGNMQPDPDPLSMPLTLRAELTVNGVTYMNISCLDAKVTASQTGNRILIQTLSRLVDKDQNDPPLGTVYCRTEYVFTPEKITLSFHCDNHRGNYLNDIRVVMPVIAESSEAVQTPGNNKIHIMKSKAVVTISSVQPLIRLQTTDERLFNFVPGLEAVPFAIQQKEATITLAVRDYE